MQKSYALAATGAASGPADAGAGKTYRQFAMKVNSPAADAVVALETSPDGTTWTEQARVTGPAWCYAASSHVRRMARPNVIGLGAGARPLGVVLTNY
jgi:hypothetical protein